MFRGRLPLHSLTVIRRRHLIDTLSKGENKHDNELRSILDQIPDGITVTVTDLEGKILYFNEYSAQIVDRKPEYIGKDIRSCHKKPESIEKIDTILSEIKDGKLENYSYESKKYEN